jgi:hypothetical protein
LETVDAGFTHKFSKCSYSGIAVWKNSSVTFGIILHTPEFPNGEHPHPYRRALACRILPIINGISNTKGIKKHKTKPSNDSPISIIRTVDKYNLFVPAKWKKR